MNSRCPRDEMFMDYLEDRLSNKDRSRIERHLSACDSCLEELLISRGVLRGWAIDALDPVPDEVTERAVKAVKALENHAGLKKIYRLLKEKRSEWGESFMRLWPRDSLSLASVRGSKKTVSENFVHIKKSFSGFDAEIEIEKTGNDKALMSVMIGEAGSIGPIRVTLFKDGREMASYLANSAAVQFEDIPFDHYILAFIKDGSKIGEYPLEITENRHGRK